MLCPLISIGVINLENEAVRSFALIHIGLINMDSEAVLSFIVLIK